MGTIIFSQHVDSGAPGVDSDPFNPLARATRALLHGGSGFRNATSIYFEDPATRELRWFGLYVEGESGRIVFFPGLAEQPDRIGYQREGHRYVEKPHLADHVTLKSGWDRWHSTERVIARSRTRRSRGGRQGFRQGGAWTRPIGEGNERPP